MMKTSLMQLLCALCLTMTIEPQHVKRVVDGDTVILFTIDAPPERSIRVWGVDTPERNQPRSDEATNFTRRWILQGPFVLSTCQYDSFGRRLGTFTRDGVGLHTALIDAGLGVKRESK